MAKYEISVQANRTTVATYSTDSESKKNTIVNREKRKSTNDAIFVNNKMVWRRRK